MTKAREQAGAGSGARRRRVAQEGKQETQELSRSRQQGKTQQGAAIGQGGRAQTITNLAGPSRALVLH